MRLGAHNFVAANPANAGQDMYTALMGAASPVPAMYMHVKELTSAVKRTVPVTQAGDFHAAAGYDFPVPNQEATFLAARRTFEARVTQQAVGVHQRGYAIIDSTSPTPLLSTLSIAPCIAVVVHGPNTATSALAHVDANMNAASIADVVGEFSPGVPLDVYFHGGLAQSQQSPTTCVQLLQALYQLEGGHQRFTVRQFDVVTRPHASEITFDSATAALTPNFAIGTTPYDSTFRTLRNGTYLTGDAVSMADACERMVASPDASVAAAGVAARNLRKQFDARPDKIRGFLTTLETRLYTSIASAAVQRAGQGSATAVNDSITAVLRPQTVLELVETNFRSYLTPGTVKAGDRRFLVEALISALLNGENVTDATKTWLIAARR
jgi:hypothetical protein